MDKKFWGPVTWYSIHNFASNYKPEAEVSYKNFMESLQYLLPCHYCRDHLKINLQENPIIDYYLQDNNHLLYWSWNLHNIVNKHLGKRQPSFQSIRNHYLTHNQPYYWEPNFWQMFHAMSASFNPDTAEKYKQFVFSLPGLLPDNYGQIFLHAIRTLPLSDEYLKSNHNLFLWSYQIHNIVNRSTGQTIKNYEEFKKDYFNNKVCKSCKK